MNKRIKKSVIAIILMIALVVTPNSFVKAKEVVNYDEVIKKADIMANLLTKVYGVTSIQYALIDNGEVVVSGNSGVYSKEKETSLVNTSMYGIGSISKMFTTVAVMQLVDAGKVKLDAAVTKYIPEFKMADSRYEDITVRMLLNHSSGIMGSSFRNTMLFGDKDLDGYNNLLDSLATQRLKADPGEFSVYCNDGFSLAQLLVEEVSQVSFTDYIRKYITEPLRLQNTKTPQDDFNMEQLAKTYYSNSNILPVENLSVIGAGGIYSTAEDMCYFAELFMNYSDAKFLSKTSAKAMAKAEYKNGVWNPAADTSAVAYGLGWDNVNTYPFSQYGIKAFVKGGDTILYHSSLIVLPEEGMAMAVLSSGGASSYGQLFAQEVLLKALLAKGAINEIIPNKSFQTPVKTTMPAEYKAYSGYYSTNGAICKINISDDGMLSLSILGNTLQSSIQKFVYTGDGKFYYKDGSNYVSFHEESNGITYLFSSGYASLPNIGQLATAEYQAQKITSNSITEELKAVWKKRDKKIYYIIDEKYSSELYMLGNLTFEGELNKELDGYFSNAYIVNENTAQAYLEIPGMYGRDLTDLNFYLEGKTEYLKSGNRLYISEDAVKSLSEKTSFQVKINSKGYASWYKLGDKLQDKKIKVNVPKNASFSVYKADGTLVYNSWISKPENVTLPANGFIVFSGNAGAKFSVKYVK